MKRVRPTISSKELKSALNELGFKENVHFELGYADPPDTVVIRDTAVIRLCELVEEGIAAVISETETGHSPNTAVEIRKNYLSKH